MVVDEEEFAGWGWSIVEVPVSHRRLGLRHREGSLDDSLRCSQGHWYPEPPVVEDGWRVCLECRAENELKMRVQVEVARRRFGGVGV